MIGSDYINTTQINYSEIIIKTLNDLLFSIFSSIDNSLYSLLDNMAFIDKSILSNSLFSRLINSAYGITLLANSLLVGFALYYCYRMLLSHFLGNQIEKSYHFLLKLLVCAICINSYSSLCEQILNLNSLISSSILEIGSNIIGTNLSFSSLITSSNQFIAQTSSTNILSFNGILKSLTTFGLLNLLFSYSIRYILVKVFILLGPFALISLTNQTSIWFFKSWFRNFLSLLLVQSLIAIIFLIIFSFNLSENTLLLQISYTSAIFILTKTNNYMKELFGGISTDFNLNITNFKNLLR